MTRRCILITALAFSLEFSPLHGQSRTASQVAEYGHAAVILTHEPGEEIFPGILHPAAALFEEYMDTDQIVAEHRNYRRMLSETGAEVLTVKDVLLEGTRDAAGRPVEGEKLEALRRLADGFLTYNTVALDPQTAARQESERQHMLAAATPEDLVRIILLQPQVILAPTPTNTGVTADYKLSPVMNLFYMRDQMITTARGVVIGRMNSPQREKECDIAEFCLRKMGIPAIHRIGGEGAYLEGGDFYPFGNKAFIGCGMRTTQAAIDQLMKHDLLGCDTLVVVKDRLWSQAQMHLDTYFNVIDRDLATLSTERMTTDPESTNCVTADIYVRQREGDYRKTESDVGFVELLTDRLQMQIIPITPDDQQRLANNFLTVAPRRIMAVDGQSETLREALRKQKVDVKWIPLDNLKKGYGAAHCMTQVVLRK